MADRILVTRATHADAMALLERAGDCRVWPEDRPMPRPELLQEVAGADGLYCMLTDAIDDELLTRAVRLRVVSQMAVGVDNIDLSACARRGVVVGHTPDVLTETTADTAFGLLIAAARRFQEGIDDVRQGRWGVWRPDYLLGGDLHGTTLGIIGLGRIGQAVARRAAGFGMRVLYHQRTRDRDAEAQLGAVFAELETLLAEADHVVLAAPLTEATRHLIGPAELRAMKSTATLVNIGRGPLVDPDALAGALRDGWIAAAGLDVTEPEPIPPDHPLVALPNCTIIPHLGSASHRTRRAMAVLAAENLVAGLAGRPLVASP